MRHCTPWTIALLLLAAPFATALAQEHMMPESLAQMNGAGTGVLLLDASHTSMLGVGDATKTEMTMDLVGGLSLRRTSEMQRQDLFGQRQAGLPFGYLYHSTDSTEFTFALTGRSHLSYTDRRKQDLSFTQQVRGFQNYRGFALDQGLGAGSSSMTFSFSAGTREEGGPSGTPVRSFQEQAFGLQGGFGSFGQLRMGFNSMRPDDPRAVATSNFAASLAPSFSGGAGLLGFSQTRNTGPGVDTTQVNTDIILPLHLSGNVARSEFHRQSLTGTSEGEMTAWLFASPLDMLAKGASFSFSDMTQFAGGQMVAANYARQFAMPLAMLGKGAAFEWSDTEQLAGSQLVAGKSITAFVLPLGLLGQGAGFGWHFTSETKAGVRTDSRVASFNAPLDRVLRGGTLSWLSVGQLQAGVDSVTRTTTIAAPLDGLRHGAALTWQSITQEKPGLEGEQRITTLVAPLRFFGRAIAGSFTTQTLTVNGAETDQQSYVFNVPVQDQQMTLGETHIMPFAADGKPGAELRIRVTNLPPIRLFTDALHAGFAETRTETQGGPTVTNTTIQSMFTPSPRLLLAGQLQQTDGAPGQSAHSTNVKADYAFMPSLTLNWRYLESQAAGTPRPSVERYVGVAHQSQGFIPIQMRLGYTTYDTPTGLPQDSAMSVHVALGTPERTSLTASYTEFDENSLGLLPQEIVALALTQRLGALGVRMEYQDQPGRPAPLRGMTLAGAMLGGNVTLSHVSNPQDPRDPKLIRDANQWDAAVKRQLLGLDVDLGYRYCEFRRSVNQVEQYLRLSLASGQASGAGQLRLTYLSGDFVPQPSGQSIPGSALELSYGKRWGDSTEVSLTLRRNTVPVGSLTPLDETEGRMEIRALW